jgi:general secretion pathway protein H
MTDLPRNPREGVQGFTLVEMMVVLAILALLATLTLPSFDRGRRDPRPEQIVQDLQSMMFAARANALVRGQVQSVEFDLEDRKVSGANRVVRLGVGTHADLLIGQELVSGSGRAVLLFYAEGGSSGAKITLSDQTGSAGLTVSWLTGVPAIEDAND